MTNILKSIKLDHDIMKSRYPMFMIGYVVGILFAVLSKTPILETSIVMVMAAPLAGQYFSVYEKNNLEKLHGVLPLKASEIVIGRYLYALCIVVVNGVIATIVAYIISFLTGSGMGGLETLNFLSIAFLYFCLTIAVIFPLYFKFPFSKVYVLSNLPFYLIFIITLGVARKTNALKQTSQSFQYLSSNLTLAAIALGLGIILLAISCLLSSALIEGNRPAPLPLKEPGKRLHFADNLRTWMVILVVLQHLAEIYNTLYLFMMLNSAYFMGLLFLLSGYFTPGSFERRGPGTFLKDRLLRLGVPTLIYVFIISPIARIGTHGLAGYTPASLFALGPMWFAVMLLVFDLGYLAWRTVMKNRTEHPVPENALTMLTFPKVALFTLALAAVSYLFRIAVPYGIPVLEFPSLGYLPQYLSFFLIGMLALRRGWLRTISGSLGKIGFVLAVLATVILFPVAVFIGKGSPWIGHGTWQSAVFALWDSVFAVGMSLALVTFFRSYVNGGKRFGRFLSQHSFTVYVIHAPILVFLALALRGLQMQLLLKFCLAAIVYLPLSFGIAWIIRKIPYVKKIF